MLHFWQAPAGDFHMAGISFLIHHHDALGDSYLVGMGVKRHVQGSNDLGVGTGSDMSRTVGDQQAGLYDRRRPYPLQPAPLHLYSPCGPGQQAPLGASGDARSGQIETLLTTSPNGVCTLTPAPAHKPTKKTFKINPQGEKFPHPLGGYKTLDLPPAM